MTNKLGTEISANGHFKKNDLIQRIKEIAKFISESWWCEIENSQEVVNYS